MIWARNAYFYMMGIVFLALAKAKNVLRGYATPRTFSSTDFHRSIEYDIHVASNWISSLEQYTGQKADLSGKTVLELGPGADLGTALYLIYKGVDRYTAFDTNNLAMNAPAPLYDQLLDRLLALGDERGSERVATELIAFRQGINGRLKYVVCPDFDICSAIPQQSIDLIFSQAAFEHFDDVEITMRQLSTVARPGAVLVTEIDLATHSRWIRDVDPLNIYRYSERVYSLFSFRGSPNRVLPSIYRDTLNRAGWTNIQTSPLKVLDHAAIARIREGLNIQYAEEITAMPALSIMLCATRL